MLLASSILAAAVVGFSAYRTGTSALREAAQERLTELRLERTRALRQFYTDQRGAAVIDSRVSAAPMQQFSAAYHELETATLTPRLRQRLERFYTDDFLPELQANSDGDLSAESFLPTSPARSYVQAHYTAASNDWDEKLALDDAGDGSAWSAANARWQPFFRQVVLGTGAEDVLLVDPDGDVVFTAYKGVDLGSNIKRGEYAGGALERVFDAAVRSNSVDYTTISDLEPYQPSYNVASQFVASPVTDRNDEVIGVYVVQVSQEAMNNIMTGDERTDVVQGLGQTGETIVAGPDALMRSVSRLLVEDPEEFQRKVTSSGTSDAVAEREVAQGTSAMLQPLPTARSAFLTSDRSGVLETTDYLGDEVLASYGPADIEGLDWTVVAKISSEEALEPVHDFARSVLISTALVVLLVCLASLLMARVFTAPTNRLLQGVRAVAGGNLGTRVDARSNDEFGDLGAAFNDMSASLLTKQRLLEEQQEENDRILASLMPATVAERYKQGETEISGEHDNVSVVYLEIDGFDDFASGRSAAESLALLNSLARAFEDAAARSGVEKVRSMGTGYVASSGLVVQHVDHPRRVVDFAVEVARAVQRFNDQHGSRLVVRAGVHSGVVSSGLVSRGDVVYNLWGEAVDLAYRVRTAAGEPGVYLTDTVKERLGTAYDFEPSGTVTVGDRSASVWRVDVEGS